MANIQIKTSKRLADLLNKNNGKYTIYQKQMTQSQFNWYVDGSGSFDNDIDFNYNTGKYNVLAVEYPAEYYACNRYITTKDLHKIFNTCKEKTLDCFIKAFNEYIEI